MTLRRFIKITVFSILATALALPVGRIDAKDLDVPYVPTPTEMVEAMLNLANTRPGDILYDLGSGDGRIVITAVRDFGVGKAVGVDLNPIRIAEARRNARQEGVSDRTTFVHGDVFKFDFQEASVLTMYLLTRVNLQLKSRILAMKPGTRVVSHAFRMGDWQPDRQVRVKGNNAYLWVVPANVKGEWTWANRRLSLKQRFQKVSGVLHEGDGRKDIRDASLTGTTLRLSLPKDGKMARFEGEVRGTTIEGSLDGEPVTLKRVD